MVHSSGDPKNGGRSPLRGGSRRTPAQDEDTMGNGTHHEGCTSARVHHRFSPGLAGGGQSRGVPIDPAAQGYSCSPGPGQTGEVEAREGVG